MLSELSVGTAEFHYCTKKRNNSFHILVCEKNVSAYSCNSEIMLSLKYSYIIN